MNKVKKIHFVGVKGVGMAPLAVIAKQAGCDVSGCDIQEEFITDSFLKKSGISPLVGFSEEHIKDANLVITTSAHGGFDNREVRAAKISHIPILTQGEAVGSFMKGSIIGREFEGISVAGSHGKTTTTALIATIFKNNGYDPSYIIGTGSIESLEGAGHLGGGKYFVAEADEYATEPNYNKTSKLLWQFPKIAVFTNIELDHPDLFSSVDEVREVFLQFTKNIDPSGLLIACGDDPQIKILLSQISMPVITYGFSENNNFSLKEVHIFNGKTNFSVESGNATLGTFSIHIMGQHNALNALAALIVSLEVGVSVENVKKGLLAFKGSQRRLEFKGVSSSGATFFDDYAHHPTEIKATLASLHQGYPAHKIVCIFQPHTYSRTKKLFDQFSDSFYDANTVILTDIYPSLREEKDPTISSELLVEKMSKFHANVFYIPKNDIVEYVNQKNFGKDTIVVTMGAGDIYKILDEFS